jgi:predicted nuclease of predicted toxin-antitoxin system
MKFKLDENFGTRTQKIFRDAGHDIHTVRDEQLHGCSDVKLFEICGIEQRCIVTLDLDFSDVTRFPPEKAGGIAVIRVPKNPSLELLENLIRQFLQALLQMSIEKKLWIIEPGRIRIHQQQTEDED